jgi:hypothetical protein
MTFHVEKEQPEEVKAEATAAPYLEILADIIKQLSINIHVSGTIEILFGWKN